MGLADELRQLEELRVKSILSEEEYAQAKQRLLGNDQASQPKASSHFRPWVKDIAALVMFALVGCYSALLLSHSRKLASMKELVAQDRAKRIPTAFDDQHPEYL